MFNMFLMMNQLGARIIMAIAIVRPSMTLFQRTLVSPVRNSFSIPNNMR